MPILELIENNLGEFLHSISTDGIWFQIFLIDNGKQYIEVLSYLLGRHLLDRIKNYIHPILFVPIVHSCPNYFSVELLILWIEKDIHLSERVFLLWASLISKVITIFFDILQLTQVKTCTADELVQCRLYLRCERFIIDSRGMFRTPPQKKC